MSLEDIKVLNKGPRAAFKLIDGRMTNAYMTMGAQMSILQYLNGQNAGYTSNFNGFAEALNDNSTASFDGKFIAVVKSSYMRETPSIREYAMGVTTSPVRSIRREGHGDVEPSETICWTREIAKIESELHSDVKRLAETISPAA
jgi:hypothetical protein